MQDILNVCLLCFVAVDVVVWRLHVRKTNAVIDRQGELLERSRAICHALRSKRDYSAEVSKSQVKACRERANGLLGELEKIYSLAAAATGHHDDPSQPVEVGDPDTDPLCLEITHCGPEHISVYAARGAAARSAGCIEFHDHVGRMVVRIGDRVVLVTHKGIGHAKVVDVSDIIIAVRRYNRSYHASKGVEDASAVTENGRADNDRRRHHDHGRQNQGRGSTSRSDSSEERARSSS